MKTIGRIIIGLIILYLAALLAGFVTPFLVARAELRGLIRSVLVVALFPSVLLLVVCLFWRRVRLAVLLVIPVLALILIYAPRWIPRANIAPADTPQITLLTFNIKNAEAQLDSITTLIQQANADVIGLQELSITAAEHFAAALVESHPNQALYPHENPNAGQGIFSRYPILDSEYWRNDQFESTLGHMWAQIDFEGTPIRVFNSHPIPAFSFEKGFVLQSHSDAVKILLERADAVDEPVIVLGDFNMTEQYDEYAAVTQTYTDTYLEVGDPGFGFTFPAGNLLPPVIRLDYIFHDDSFQGVEAHLLARSGTSDHLPVWARLALVEDAIMQAE